MASENSGRPIPTRRVVINDPAHMPSVYSQTPGGTMFSTTPGGTRIVYDRAFMLQLRNSPLAQTPPANLPDIPGCTSPLKKNTPTGRSPLANDPAINQPSASRPPQDRGETAVNIPSQLPRQARTSEGDEAQFQMDI